MATYAVADLHGQYNLFEQIKNFIQPEDTVYVLGDCADRGADGWKIIEEVYNNPQMIYIKGNHEDMLVKSMKDFFHFKDNDELSAFWLYSQDYRMSRHNGGEVTFRHWRRDTHEDPRWIHRLDSLLLRETYHGQKGDVILSHAGFTPYDDGPYDYLWDREHFLEDWPEEVTNTYIVHGHTPVPYLMDELNDHNECRPGMYVYCDGHKIDIDCGAHFTGSTVLLDLDTFEEQIFMAEDCIYDD